MMTFEKIMFWMFAVPLIILMNGLAIGTTIAIIKLAIGGEV